MKVWLYFILVISASVPVGAACIPGEIRIFTADFIPRGWAEANGDLRPIDSTSSLYQAIGKTFGGDESHFRLPDLRSRAPIATNAGPNANSQLSSTTLGAVSGSNLGVVTNHHHSMVTADIKDVASFGKRRILSIKVDASTVDVLQQTRGSGATSIAIQQPAIGLKFIICDQ